MPNFAFCMCLHVRFLQSATLDLASPNSWTHASRACSEKAWQFVVEGDDCSVVVVTDAREDKDWVQEP